ncbi:lysophospholipid acyltransferase family protein [Rhodococcus sp. 077-4]|uniref:lysophospholipid acyltransferase family protein n=1 Tax=Rhodococcus sp. 077-4 TaxID=2789271 RepID=UPI0039F604CF
MTTQPHPPSVHVDNFSRVYDFYRQHQQSRLKATALYGYTALAYRPVVRYAEGVHRYLKHFDASRASMVICSNHVSEIDQFVLSGGAFLSPLRRHIGTIRVLAKDGLFVDRRQRHRIDLMGGIPVFRPTDHGRDALGPVRALISTCVERLKVGDHVAIFPEGTRNKADPRSIQPIGAGAAHIVSRSMRQGRPIVVLPAAIRIPELSGARPHLLFGSPFTVEAIAPKRIAEEIRRAMQETVRLVYRS